MGRKSMVEVRRDEITSAVQRCIVRHGLADTTMAMVAEEAGMQRSAISHFLGSREDVITAAIERSCDYYIDLILQVVGEVPPERAAEALVKELIGGKRAEPRAMVLFDEIITLAHHHDKACQSIERAYEVLRSELEKALEARNPAAPPSDRTAVARALMLLIDNEERFRVLDLFPDEGDATRRAAAMLLSRLDDATSERHDSQAQARSS